MKLLLKSFYINRNVHYLEGMIIEVSEEEGEFLMRDAPGCFEVVGAEKALRGPLADKMVDEDDGLSKLGVRELRARLKDAGLKQAGRKPELLKRLRGG